MSGLPRAHGAPVLQARFRVVPEDFQVEEMAHKPFPTGRLSHGTIDALMQLQGRIGFKAEEMAKLARLSHPRVVVDTSGLSPEQTALANRLAQMIPKLPPETVAALHAVLDATAPQPKPRLRRAAGRRE